MEQQIAELVKTALDARLANLALVLIIVLVVAVVAIFVIMRPVWISGTRNQGLLVQNLANVEAVLRTLGERVERLDKTERAALESAQQTARSIELLREELNKHMIQINLRFDQLPQSLQQVLGAEIVRYFQRPRFGLWEFFRGRK